MKILTNDHTLIIPIYYLNSIEYQIKRGNTKTILKYMLNEMIEMRKTDPPGGCRRIDPPGWGLSFIDPPGWGGYTDPPGLGKIDPHIWKSIDPPGTSR